MGYYDNVKDSIRDENDDSDSEASTGEDSGGGMNAGNFDTLREAAEETEVEDEEGGDNTPIEVLEEDGLKPEAPSKQQKRNQASTQTQQQRQNTQQQQQGQKKQEQQRSPENQAGNTQSSQTSERQGSRPQGGDVSGDTSDLEDKLDKIIEQNARMIEILEGFGN